MSRRMLLVASMLVVASLVAAHVVYWYGPRVRAGRPGEGLVGRVLASETFPTAVWVPYPHQNLAVLEASAAVPRELVDAVARLAGLPRPQWPAFGPLRMPPSKEVAFASNGERFVLAAEVYPTAALFARLAGRLADNPWLAGGALTVDERRLEVAWHGNTWTVASPSMPRLEEPSPGGPSEPPGLVTLAVREAIDPLPAGRLRLTVEKGDFVLRSADRIPAFLELEGRPPAASVDDLRLVLLTVSSRRESVARPAQALALYAPGEPVALATEGGHAFDLPGMAVIYRTGEERWSLPGEGLLELTGREVRDEPFGDWSLASLDDASFNAARQLLPRLTELTEPRPEGRLAWGAWLDLEIAAVEVSRIAQAMEEVPFVAERRRQRWRDLETVFGNVSRFASRLSIVVAEDPSAFRLLLQSENGAARAP